MILSTSTTDRACLRPWPRTATPLISQWEEAAWASLQSISSAARFADGFNLVRSQLILFSACFVKIQI